MIPKLHIFNPSCETAIANGSISYLPNKTLLRFENDLSYLSSLFAQNEDLVLMPQYEPLEHIELLHRLNFPVPGQILQADFFDINQKIIAEIEEYALWGWAPNWVHRLKRNERVSCNAFETSPFYQWKHELKDFYSRVTAKNILSHILEEKSSVPYIPLEFLPEVLKTVEEVDAFLQIHQKVVLKEPWSSSGRGIIMLRKSSLNVSVIQRVKGILNQQAYIMAEVMMDKQLDMALQYSVTNKQLKFEGASYFKTGSNGQYLANYLNQSPDPKSPEGQFINEHIEQLKKDIQNAIEKTNIPKYYTGYFGVDIMIVKVKDQFMFQPCVEINLRKNMGIVALKLEQLIHPEALGTFNVVFNPKANFESIYKEISEPQIIEDGKLLKGSLPIVQPNGKQFGAYIHLI